MQHGEDFLDPLIDNHFKGYPHHQVPLRRSQIARQAWNVLKGDLPLPLAVIKRDALAGNLAWMQNFARERGLDMAPHGKTTMSPQLFRRQLDAGAWGITFATITQARVGIAAGVQRCLIANQVLTSADLAAIQRLIGDNLGLRIVFLVDSVQQLDLIESWYRSHETTGGGTLRPFEVLLEIGLVGGRTGCRDNRSALQLARRIRASQAAKLVGVECYELWSTGDVQADRALVDGLLGRVVEVAHACDRERLYECDEVLISAGGSAIFDLVAAHLKPGLSQPVRGILRSGCYVTFDHGNYKRLMSVMNSRLSCGHGLNAAMEVWTTVQSRPEPGLAILTAGRRDVSFDSAMPKAVYLCRLGQATAVEAPTEWTVTTLNDQHAYLRAPEGATLDLQVGDRIGLGISHPCTTFDKWRWMALVDDDYNVVDAIVTNF